MEFRTSVSRTLGLVAGGLLLIAVSYWLTRQSDSSTRFVGWIGVAFSGVCLIAIAFQLFRRKPTVVFGDSGVLDIRLGVGLIPWSDIASVSICAVRRQRFIALSLRDEGSYRLRSPIWRRVLIYIGDAMNYPAFTLAFGGLRPGIDEAYAFLSKALPARAGT